MKLRKEVARKYEATTTQPVIRRFGGSHVDLRTLSLKEANELYHSGSFPYLKLKEKEPPKEE